MDAGTITAVAMLLGALTKLLAELRRWLRRKDSGRRG